MSYYRTRRPKVQWKDEQVSQPKALLPFPLVQDYSTDEEVEIRVPHLTVGSLWNNRIHLYEDARFDEKIYRRHEHSYLVSAKLGSRVSVRMIEHGTLVVYMGDCRVEEAPWNLGKTSTRRVQRFKFLVGGRIYLASNLRDFDPIFD